MTTTFSAEQQQHLLNIKQKIAASYPDFETRATKAWVEIIAELGKATEEIVAGGTEVSASSCFTERYGTEDIR
jgi:hypothetical protein